MVWALGRCGHGYDPAVFGPLLAVVRSKLGSFMPQVGVLYESVFATTSLSLLLTAEAETACVVQVVTWINVCVCVCVPVQGISNMVWALGQLGHHDPELLAALSRECPPHLHSYDAQALSNLAAGLAALGNPATQPLMVAVVNEAANRGTRMAPQHMASVLNAAATRNIHNDRLLAAVLDVLHTRANSLDGSTLATFASAAVAMKAHLQAPGSTGAALLAPLANAVLGSIDKLHGQVSNMRAWPS